MCKHGSSAAAGFVNAGESALMQIVMLVLVESIRRTLCTGSWKLKSVLASEAARVWIMTSPAFTVHDDEERTCSPPLLCSLFLRGNNLGCSLPSSLSPSLSSFVGPSSLPLCF